MKKINDQHLEIWGEIRSKRNMYVYTPFHLNSTNENMYLLHVMMPETVWKSPYLATYVLYLCKGGMLNVSSKLPQILDQNVLRKAK